MASKDHFFPLDLTKFSISRSSSSVQGSFLTYEFKWLFHLSRQCLGFLNWVDFWEKKSSLAISFHSPCSYLLKFIKTILVGLPEDIVLLFGPCDSSSPLKDTIVLVLKETNVFLEEDGREGLPVFFAGEGFNSTEFDITNEEPNKKPPFVLMPGSPCALINARIVPLIS